MRQEASIAEHFLLALECDDAFLSWTQKMSGMVYPPIVRASTYPRIWKWQEFNESRLAPDDQRRPVIMRGSRGHMRKRRFEKGKWTYPQEITRRYLRRIK